MQVKTIKKIIIKKLEDWLQTITDQKLRQEVKDNILVSGGSITSLFQNQPVNDYDIYIQDMDVLIKLANYYCSGYVLDGRNKVEYLKKYCLDVYHREISLDEDLSEQAVRLKGLKEDQVKLNIPSVGIRREPVCEEGKEKAKYQVVFLSQNAISLSDDLQIVLRFNGDAQQIHKTFDFIHATNYFTFKDGLVTNIKALESIITKQLSYQGSLYPLTSIIRIKKFLNRGWSINAGEMLKIMFQISELDLRDPQVLEEQLIGVDIAYFSTLIEILRGVPSEKLSASYLSALIDKVFNEHEEEEGFKDVTNN